MNTTFNRAIAFAAFTAIVLTLFAYAVISTFTGGPDGTVRTSAGLTIEDATAADLAGVAGPYTGHGPMLVAVSPGSLGEKAGIPASSAVLGQAIWIEAVNGVPTPSASDVARAMDVDGTLTVTISTQTGSRAVIALRGA